MNNETSSERDDLRHEGSVQDDSLQSVSVPGDSASVSNHAGTANSADSAMDGQRSSWIQTWVEVALLTLLFFAYAGDPPPMVNEAHYLVKAKHFWDPSFCQNDMFVASGKAHTTFYVLFGWPTRYFSLETTAWIGRLVGWTLLAFGLQRLCWALFANRFASLAVAMVWMAGIEYGNLAGEWVIGGIEAKVPAYGLVLWALAELVRRRWNRVWILLGAASAFHVLSGGWAVVASLVCWGMTERGRPDGVKLFTPALFIGGGIALFGLLPAIALTIGGNPEDSRVAARIYSYYRIKHHLLPADFYPHWFLRHSVLIVAMLGGWLAYRRRDGGIRRLGWFAIGTLAIAAIGLLVGVLPQVAPDLAAKLLRYYWFRLSDAVVPLMFAVIATKLLMDQARLRRVAGVVVLGLAIALIGYSQYRRSRLGVPPSVSNDLLGRDAGAAPEVQRAVYGDWLAVCRWARVSTGCDEVFLTPRHQQTFKWYAERAEVVNWKDVPQDAAALREWYRRFQEIYPRRLGHVRVTIRYSTLQEYRQAYGVRYLIVDRRISGSSLPLVQVYPLGDEQNDTYAVYEMPLVTESKPTIRP
ncbi:MAG: DUF6798 domain-containing protein [Rubripirellula sp.]